MEEDVFHAFELTGRTYDTGSKLGYLEAFLAISLEYTDHGSEAAAMIKTFAEKLLDVGRPHSGNEPYNLPMRCNE